MSFHAILIPLPPPPADALIITGYPISLEILIASSAFSIKPMWPGTQETPASIAIFFEVILSPIDMIACALGPIKVISLSSSLLANSAFSDKNPYPGCTASEPVSAIALRSLSITK